MWITGAVQRNISFSISCPFHVRGDYSKIPHACAALLIGFGPFIAAFVWAQAVYELGNSAIANSHQTGVPASSTVCLGLGLWTSRYTEAITTKSETP